MRGADTIQGSDERFASAAHKLVLELTRKGKVVSFEKSLLKHWKWDFTKEIDIIGNKYIENKPEAIININIYVIYINNIYQYVYYLYQYK